MLRIGALLCAAGCALGCAPQQGEPKHPQQPSAASGAAGGAVGVPRTIVTPDDARSIPELYEQARLRFERSEYAEAARAFDRVVQLDPGGDWAPAALYAAGVAHDHAGDHAAAVARLEQVLQRHPSHEVARESRLRAIRLLTHLEQWGRAGQLAEALVSRGADPRAEEAIVAHGAKALALIETGDLDRAQYHVEKARQIVEDQRLDAAGRIPRDVAVLFFALGEIRRIRAERIQFDPLPAQFGVELERRCQLLLDAQSAYSDTMRAYDAHWSAMAGYRVGELYQTLHQELMRVPTPPSADTEARRQLFEGAMRLRYSVLLQKALAMMDHTLQMARRVRERSTWVERAEQAARELRQAMEREERALAALPYSRAELESALDRLAQTSDVRAPN